MSDYYRGDRPGRPENSWQAGGSRFGERTVRPVGDRRTPRAAASQPAERSARRPAAGPPARRQNRPKSVPGFSLPKGFWLVAVVCAAIIVSGLLLQGAMPAGFPLVRAERGSAPTAQRVSEIYSRGPIRINEIMTSNNSTLTDETGNTPDWVEIANIGSGSVNIGGYILARRAKAGNVFVFPDAVLSPGECIIVYADSSSADSQREGYHAPFRLSSTGDVLMLFNQADVAIDTVNIPALAQNAVYVRESAARWSVSDRATPGMPNTDESLQAMAHADGAGEVQIAEVMSSSANYGPDENGICHDYAILRNVSANAVDLSGWYLSDNRQMPRMWRFPAGTVIAPGAALLVHCSGLNRTGDVNHLHTGFKLKSEGEELVLSNAEGKAVDEVTFDLLKTDTAYVRGNDGSWAVGDPTAPRI